MNVNTPSQPTESEMMAYDLRQRYAKIVGDHLEDVAIQRKANNYTQHYEALKDLYIEVRHKIKDLDKDKKGFYEWQRKLSVLANKHQQTWTGHIREPIAVHTIENELGEFEMWIKELMESSKMFGNVYQESDDEL